MKKDKRKVKVILYPALNQRIRKGVIIKRIMGSTLLTPNGNLYYLDDEPIESDADSDSNWLAMSLVFVAQDRVKVGDLIVVDERLFNNYPSDYKIRKVVYVNGDTISTSNRDYNIDAVHKVIASTNDYYNVPQPSDAFCKKYVELYNAGNPISYVMVDYIQPIAHEIEGLQFMSYNLQPAVDKNNNITIHKYLSTYTREQVIDIATQAFSLGITVSEKNIVDKMSELKEWINENIL